MAAPAAIAYDVGIKNDPKGMIAMNDTPTGTAIVIDLPAGILGGIAESPELFAGEFRLAAAIEWYREGRVSQGKGAAIAGLCRADFLDALFRAKVSASQVTVDELKEEVDRAVESHRRRLAADPPREDGST